MNRFPAFFDLTSSTVIIVGGGSEAIVKARLVAATGATLKFVWTFFEPELRREFSNARYFRRIPELSDFEAGGLAFIACGGERSNRWARIARAAGAIVNVVDEPDLCDFTTPAIVDRGRVTVAISTDGAAPVLGQNLRGQIESLLPYRVDRLAAFADQYRNAVKAKVEPGGRREFWREFFNGPVAAKILEGDETGAHEDMLARVNGSRREITNGIVHIVGAGPGDPDLLTLKAFRLIQDADVIVHDRLVTDEILALARRDATRLYVGKSKARHTVEQSEIEQKLIEHARDGKKVVRLKGGDPFIFGRGGEELEAVRAAGIPVTVTPGVTAAIGCAASAGIALTHRDYSQSVTFVTGHGREDSEPDLDWRALAAIKNTLVVYMGVEKASTIAGKLISHGRAASTPIAIIENGTRRNEKTLTGKLRDLPQLITKGDVSGPAVLVIGEIAALATSNSLVKFVDMKRNAA